MMCVRRIYRAESGYDVGSDGQRLVERPGGDQRSLHLYAQLLRHITEWLEVGGSGGVTATASVQVGDAAEVAVVEDVLAVE